jgi:hypothetical protein
MMQGARRDKVFTVVDVSNRGPYVLIKPEVESSDDMLTRWADESGLELVVD